jgi:hypothetical protein
MEEHCVLCEVRTEYERIILTLVFKVLTEFFNYCVWRVNIWQYGEDAKLWAHGGQLRYSESLLSKLCTELDLKIFRSSPTAWA